MPSERRVGKAKRAHMPNERTLVEAEICMALCAVAQPTFAPAGAARRETSPVRLRSVVGTHDRNA